MSDARREFLAEHVEAKGGEVNNLLARRFVAVETVQGKKGAEQYAHGHETLRQACDALAEATKQGGLAEFVLDLDKSFRHDLDVSVAVAPKGVDARMVILPGGQLRALVEDISDYVRDPLAKRAMNFLRAAAK